MAERGASAAAHAGGPPEFSAAWMSAGRRVAVACLFLLVLSSCAIVPEGLSSVERSRDADPWSFLPLRAWVTRETVSARAIGVCDGEACAARVVVGAFEARGREARELEAAIGRTGALIRRLDEGNERRRARVAEMNAKNDPAIRASRMPARTRSEARALRHGTARGFAVKIQRLEGDQRVAHGAVLAERRGEALRFVVAVGETAAATEAFARQVIEANR